MLAIWVGMGWRGGSACGPASGGAHGGRRPCASREGSTGAIYRVQRSEDKRGRGLKDELDEEGRNWWRGRLSSDGPAVMAGYDGVARAGKDSRGGLGGGGVL